MKVSTEDLIKDLSQDLKPVKVLKSPFKRWLTLLGYLTFVLALVFVLFASFSSGGFISAHFTSTSFFIELSTLLVLSLIGAYATLVSTVPGREFKTGSRGANLLLFIWLGYVIVRWVTSPLPVSAESLHFTLFCPLTTISLGVGFVAIMAFELKKGARFHLCWTNWTLWLSAGAIGALVPHIFCPERGEGHLIIFHILPVILLAVFGLYFSNYKKNNS